MIVEKTAGRRQKAVGGRRWFHFLLLTLFALLLVACATPTLPAPTPDSVPPTAISATLTPEPAVIPSPTSPASNGSTVNISVPTLNANNPQGFIFPTPIIYPTSLNSRPPVEGVPLSINPRDHFWFARPIASDNVNWPLGTYRYGSDYYGQMYIHAGIDIDAPEHTPVLAAGPGQVVWAGWGLFYFEYGRLDDPYGIAVAVRHDFGYQNKTLYTLYAHLEAENNLFVGQRVETGDVLGWIGLTGNTTGPHVHFEVREGRNNFFDTRNPELWIAPYSGWGVLSGQLLDKNGRYIPGHHVEIFDEANKFIANVYTYGTRVANPDDQWKENFVISDLPAGRYHLRAIMLDTETEAITRTSEVIQTDVQVVPGQTNYVVLRASSSFPIGAFPADTATPVHPIDTATVTNTPTETPTETPTRTPRPTNTVPPTWTRAPTTTPFPTWTRPPSATPLPTRTPSNTPTPRATATPQP